MSNGDFTKEDRARAVRTETLLTQVVKNQDNLPCAKDPAWRGVIGTEVESLKGSRKKTIGALIVICVAMFIAAIKAIAGLF
jgi:hypothetical protein